MGFFVSHVSKARHGAPITFSKGESRKDRVTEKRRILHSDGRTLSEWRIGGAGPASIDCMPGSVVGLSRLKGALSMDFSVVGQL
jgi:hypothetical protein